VGFDADVNRIGYKLTAAWVALGPRFLPFADVATPDLPLRRLLRLSLFQVSVGMALVLLVGTLNRVMIVELGVPASLVGVMIALPLVFAPFRALIGFRSDTHRCELGWRRVPFIWHGTLMQFGGFAIMPFALLVLAGKLQAADAPLWIGQVSAALAFLLVGAGVHMVQTAGLALATDLTPPESHPKVVGLMYVMLLLGMIASALVFGAALARFSPGRLVQVIQGVAVATALLNLAAMWKQETRRPPRGAPAPAPDPSFRESWASFCEGEHALRRLVVVGIGTMAFGMSDILLEPFGGQVLHLNVGATTKLTALLALGGLLGFGFASQILSRGGDAYRMARDGALIGLPAFALVILAAPIGWPGLFLVGNFLIGFGGALFGHGTLTATMNRAPRHQAGLALGAWGAVQATAAGLGMALSGTIRDLVNAALGATEGPWGLAGAASGYVSVYAIEVALLLVTIAATVPLVRRSPAPDAESHSDLGLALDGGSAGAQAADSRGGSAP
jgi:BCD family chlorophyll transporter-like MFS transporter